MFGWLANMFRGSSGASAAAGGKAAVSAGYDVAQTTDDNARHWANADNLSPKAAASAEVRRTIRQRARYEAHESNCYAKGLVATLTNHVVGNGPRLQLRTEDREIDTRVEQLFAQWSAETGFAEKLRTLKTAKTVDGEAFAHFITNRALTHSVKLDLALAEADHFTTPLVRYTDPSLCDGIEFDADGNPAFYHRLKHHPGGDDIFARDWLASERLPAALVIHLFRCDRPAQARGISELAPALPLFAQLRRFTLATLSAAEFAASQSAVMETTSAAIVDPDDVEALDAIPFERNGLLTLPKGWKANQMRAEHPSTTYAMFKAEVINEIAVALGLPYNIAAGNSSSYNYASGKLDTQSFERLTNVERAYFARACLDRVLLAWLTEAALIPGFLPPELAQLARQGRLPTHQWFWDGAAHVDPLKEANAQATKLANHTTTLAEEYAKSGKDWETEIRQRAREVELLDELGLIRDLQPESFGDMSKEQSEEDDDGDKKPTRQAA
jgi:lambda family phage portal protein